MGGKRRDKQAKKKERMKQQQKRKVDKEKMAVNLSAASL